MKQLTADPSSKSLVMTNESFFALRDRAYELADTGRYKQWSQIAYALQAEGFLPSLITRLDDDGLAVLLITRCCRLARAG
jgi:hypothetical protein